MNAEILQKWEAAAEQLWRETPELRSRYGFNLTAYLTAVRVRLEVQEEWRDNPRLQKEFGDFTRYLAYIAAESKGLITIIGGE